MFRGPMSFSERAQVGHCMSHVDAAAALLMVLQLSQCPGLSPAAAGRQKAERLLLTTPGCTSKCGIEQHVLLHASCPAAEAASLFLVLESHPDSRPSLHACLPCLSCSSSPWTAAAAATARLRRWAWMSHGWEACEGQLASKGRHRNVFAAQSCVAWTALHVGGGCVSTARTSTPCMLDDCCVCLGAEPVPPRPERLTVRMNGGGLCTWVPLLLQPPNVPRLAPSAALLCECQKHVAVLVG